MRWSSSEHGLTFGPFRDPKWEAKSPCGRTSHHITSHLGGKFPQVSHSWIIGSGGNPKGAQILCGSPDLGDPVPDAPVPPRAPPPYPLDTFGGLRTNFSSINPSDRASVILGTQDGQINLDRWHHKLPALKHRHRPLKHRYRP